LGAVLQRPPSAAAISSRVAQRIDPGFLGLERRKLVAFELAAR
jgi:hypothetical protein